VKIGMMKRRMKDMQVVITRWVEVAPSGAIGVAVGVSMPGAVGLPIAAGVALPFGPTTWGSAWPFPRVQQGELLGRRQERDRKKRKEREQERQKRPG